MTPLADIGERARSGVVVAAVAGLTALALASPALGAQRFASPTGTGPAATCPQADPCDLDTAVENAAVVDGDEVIVTPGSYTVARLDIVDAISLHGQNLQPIPTINTTNATFSVNVNDAATLSDLKIEAPSSSGLAVGVNASGAVVERVSVHDTAVGGLACPVTESVVIRDSVCWASATNGIGVGANISTGPVLETIRLRNLTAVGASAGIAYHLGPGGNFLVDAKNVVADGPSVDIRASTVQASDSIVITLANSNYATEQESGPGTATVTDPGTGTNQTTAPTFVNAAGGDFHQTAGSPTIDAGATDGFTGTGDFDGDFRNLEGDGVCPTAPDIGADEFIGSGPIDCDPPESSINGGPTGATSDTTPTFDLVSDELGSTFECRVDSDPFVSCTTPHTTAALGDGAHTFEMRATDTAGNTDPTPATRTFTVDTTPPQSSIAGGPTGITSDTTPTFDLVSDEPGSTFECRLDAGTFAACTTPHTTAPLPDGAHTLEVRAIDAVGNVDTTPASRAFTVDTSVPPPADTDPPETTIGSAPKAKVKTKRRKVTVSLEFSSDEAGSFECALDDEPFAPCTSPTTRKVGTGKHAWSVRATDAAGNRDQSPATATFKVKRKRKRR